MLRKLSNCLAEVQRDHEITDVELFSTKGDATLKMNTGRASFLHDIDSYTQLFAAQV